MCKVINDRAYDLQDPTGHVYWASVVYTHVLMLAEYIASLIPDTKEFRRVHKYINDPCLMSYLQWTKIQTKNQKIRQTQTTYI